MPGLDLFSKDWLSLQNQQRDKDIEMPGMKITLITATDIPDWMSTQDIQQAIHQDEHLQQLKHYIIWGWPLNRKEIQQGLKP